MISEEQFPHKAVIQLKTCGHISIIAHMPLIDIQYAGCLSHEPSLMACFHESPVAQW